MTNLLEKAFTAAAKLPPEEQDVIASRLLAELAAEDDFDRSIATSAERLSRMAAEALTDDVRDLDPETL